MTDKGLAYLDARLKENLFKSPSNPLSWTEEFKVSPEEAEAFADPNFILEGLIVRGHLHVIVAEPNGGKTTIFFHLAGEMAAKRFQVIYVHADISGGDSKEFLATAMQNRVDLLLPDMKAGKSMADIVQNLEQMNKEAADLSNVIFIFDTLKKMADVINKSATKQLMGTLRGLTARGATIICLAHTNKYDGKDGKPIYEGTGDVRSDVDNLIYMIPEKHSDDSMTVSVVPDKQRAALEKMSFKISADRQVTLLEEYQDIAEQKRIQIQREKDQEAIERITEAIQKGKSKQSDIIQYCKENDVSVRQSRSVLGRYAKESVRLWVASRGHQNNALNYELIG